MNKICFQQVEPMYKYGIILLILGLLLLSHLNRVESFQNNVKSPKITFITYGNEKFTESKKRIKEEAEKTGWFTGGINVYGPENLSENFKNQTKGVINESRGGGYWIWKPYIIMDTLSKIQDGDYLVYADSGCSLQASATARFKEYIQMISPDSGHSLLVFRLDNICQENKYTKNFNSVCKENKYTSLEIFNYFNESVNGEIGNSKQIFATFLLLRKTSDSFAIISRWLEIAKTRPDLFTDKFSGGPNFIENRHDQSIFSMIIKTNKHKNASIIIDEDVSGPIRGTRIRK